MGERKSQENLKHDLVRRIKMLEFSLRQERAKVYRLTHNGMDPEPDESDNFLLQNNEFSTSNVPMDIDAIDKNDEKAANSQTWREARHLLKQYLQVWINKDAGDRPTLYFYLHFRHNICSNI